MKGHTKIELTDVETGELEVKEYDNMVTNALEKALCCAGIGLARNGLDTDISIYNYPLWQHFLGGLLLFENTVNENVNNITFPDGNSMVGNGAYGVSNSNSVIEMGSWNESESGVQEDGSLKLVWDFSTQQANGTISCVCLSSRDGAYIGAGNRSNVYNATNVHLVNGKTFTRDITSYSAPVLERIVYNSLRMLNNDESRCLLYADYLENTVTYIEPRSINYVSSADVSEHWYNSGKLKISKYRYGISSVDLLEKSEITKKISTIEVSVPDDIKTYVGSKLNMNLYSILTSGEDIYIVFYANNGIIQLNEQFKVLKISKNGETAVYNITNTSGVQLKAGFNTFSITKSGYLVAIRFDSPYDFYAININNNNDIKKIENVDKVNTSRIIRCFKNSCYTFGNTTYRIDVDLGKMLPLNGNSSNVTAFNEIPVINNPLLIIAPYTGNRITPSLHLYRSTAYLATINNLDSPVEKTSSKTMKVTYTITF